MKVPRSRLIARALLLVVVCLVVFQYFFFLMWESDKHDTTPFKKVTPEDSFKLLVDFWDVPGGYQNGNNLKTCFGHRTVDEKRQSSYLVIDASQFGPGLEVYRKPPYLPNKRYGQVWVVLTDESVPQDVLNDPRLRNNIDAIINVSKECEQQRGLFYDSSIQCKCVIKLLKSIHVPKKEVEPHYQKHYAKFDGSTKIKVKDRFFLEDISQFSIACWIRVSKSTNGMVLLSKRGDDIKGFKLSIKSLDMSQFILQLCCGYACWHSQRAMFVNRWYHIAASYDFKNKKLFFYTNGLGIKSHVYAWLPVEYTKESLYIGGTHSDEPNWNGDLDEISVWNTSLTEKDVQQLMFRDVSSIRKGLVASWSFDKKAVGGSLECDQPPCSLRRFKDIGKPLNLNPFL